MIKTEVGQLRVCFHSFHQLVELVGEIHLGKVKLKSLDAPVVLQECDNVGDDLFVNVVSTWELILSFEVETKDS